MRARFQSEMQKVKERVFLMGGLVELRLQDACRAVLENDVELAERVRFGDREIDMLELEIEEECLKLLALYQPVATDLRYLVAFLKINNDLERVGDLVVNIASRASWIAKSGGAGDIPYDLSDMGKKVQRMLRLSLDALGGLDVSLAEKVIVSDSEVDAINKEMYTAVEEKIVASPERIRTLLRLMSVSKYLERIADHATNVAEDVIYLVTSDIVRHKARTGTPKSQGN